MNFKALQLSESCDVQDCEKFDGSKIQTSVHSIPFSNALAGIPFSKSSVFKTCWHKGAVFV